MIIYNSVSVMRGMLDDLKSLSLSLVLVLKPLIFSEAFSFCLFLLLLNFLTCSIVNRQYKIVFVLVEWAFPFPLTRRFGFCLSIKTFLHFCQLYLFLFTFYGCPRLHHIAYVRWGEWVNGSGVVICYLWGESYYYFAFGCKWA